MGFLDLMTWLAEGVTPADSEEGVIDDRVVELADGARSETVTPEVLANRTDRSRTAIVEYLDDGEQPEYVFRGGRLLISDGEDSLSREHATREAQVVVSDRRVLFLLGGRLDDDIWEVRHADVRDAYVDDVERLREYLVVEAERDGAPMTFFADVSLSAEEGTRDAAAYIREG